MPNPDGMETLDEKAARLRGLIGGAGAPPPATPLPAATAVTGVLVPRPATNGNGVVSASQAVNSSIQRNDLNKTAIPGTVLHSDSNGPQSQQVGVGTGFANGTQTGIQQQGTVDPTTGLVSGGVVRAADSQYDYPTIYANQASQITQAPAVTGAAPVSAAGNAIVRNLTTPQVASNPYIQNGAVDAQRQGVAAMHAAAGIGSAGDVNSRVQSGLVAGAPGAQAGARDAQGNLIGLLTAGAEGHGPSAAQPLFQTELDKIIGAQAAAGASQRGSSTVAAANNAAQTGASAQLAAASQSAALRAQEQQAAQTQLGNVTASSRQGDTALTQVLGAITGQARGQDVDTAKSMSDAIQGVRDGTIKAADVAATATNALNATNGQLSQWAIQNGLDYGKLLQAAQAGDQSAALQLTQIMAQYSTTLKGINTNKNVAERGQNIGVISGLAGGAGNAGGAGIVKAVSGA